MLTGCYPFLRTHTRGTLEAILTWPLTFPQTPVLSKEARDLLTMLLMKEPSKRMAFIYAYQAHPFFDGLDWQALERREITPPFLPEDQGKNTKYFEHTLTGQVIQGPEEVFQDFQGASNDEEEARQASIEAFPSFPLSV